MAAKTYFKKDEFKKFKKRMTSAGSTPSVLIGVNEKKGKEPRKNGDKLTNADVATFMEFGTKTVPERSFIRSNDEQNKAVYKELIKELRKKIIFNEMPIGQALGLLGEKILADIRAGIRAGIAPELAPSTIKAKGSSLPLVDTGQLINSLTYKVNATGDKREGG